MCWTTNVIKYYSRPRVAPEKPFPMAWPRFSFGASTGETMPRAPSKRRHLKKLSDWQRKHLESIRRCDEPPWHRVNTVQNYLISLTPTQRQRDILEEITFYLEELGPYQKRKSNTIERMISEERDHLKILTNSYSGLILKAYKVGLGKHPLVEEWLKTRRVVGDWDTLRRVKGLEKGVKRPIKTKDHELWNLISRQTKKYIQDNNKLPT